MSRTLHSAYAKGPMVVLRGARGAVAGLWRTGAAAATGEEELRGSAASSSLTASVLFVPVMV
jgi:hypothetical protein